MAQSLSTRERVSLSSRVLWLAALITGLCVTQSPAAEQKTDRSFAAVVTDAEGIETEVRNFLYYWEEKLSETAFVPHEQKHVTVKRGAATINVKFEHIKTIEFTPAADGAAPLLKITLVNGKTGEFPLAIAGSFKGESDFGEINVPATGLKRISFK
jgi:hypothetical protein